MAENTTNNEQGFGRAIAVGIPRNQHLDTIV